MSNLFYNLTVNNFDETEMYAKFNLRDTRGNKVEGVYQYCSDVFTLLDYLGFALEESDIEIDQSKPINITIVPAQN